MKKIVDNFRLVITVTRADAKGRVLDRMSSGTVIAYTNIDEAVKAQTEFHGLADLIDGEYQSYGLTAIINEREMIVQNPRPL